MGFYQFIRKQELEMPMEEVWDFISSPRNLKHITPEYMGFDITSPNLPDKMYEGMIISYKVSPLLGIRTTWVTEITQVEEMRYFVDEQRIGPYKMWHHQHFIEFTSKGTTLMTDIISYQPPLGWLGSIMNALVIKRKLNEIFDYREQALEKYSAKYSGRMENLSV